MEEFLRLFVLAFVPLFVAVDPPGLLPLYVGLTEGVKPVDRRRILIESILTALAVTIGVFCLTWGIGFRRHYRRTLEAEESRPAGAGQRLTNHFWSRLLHSPAERAIFHFSGVTLARSLKHRLFLATYLSVGLAFGIDPVHLGIVFLANMDLGYLAPPVGLNLLLASYRFDQPILKVMRAVIPMFLVQFVGVLLITYVPPLTTWLPRLFR